MRFRSRAALAAAALLLSSLATSATAAGPTLPSPTLRVPSPLLAWKPRPWSPPNRTEAIRSNAFWVHRDPVDGTLGMPDPATLARQTTIGDAGAPIQIDRLPDGTLSAHLDDRFADFAVATRDAHGKTAWRCVPGKKSAAAFLTRPVIVAPPTTARVEK